MGYDKFSCASCMFVENKNDSFDTPIHRLVYAFRLPNSKCFSKLIYETRGE